MKLPYVILRTSKSGKGLHAIVRIDPVTTRYRYEHSQLAKHILVNQLSPDTGLNLINYFDTKAIGSQLWHWAKEMDSNGLKRIS